MVCLYCEGERECGMSKKRERERERERQREWLKSNRILMKVLRAESVHIESERIGHTWTPPFAQIRSKLFQH